MICIEVHVQIWRGTNGGGKLTIGDAMFLGSMADVMFCGRGALMLVSLAAVLQ